VQAPTATENIGDVVDRVAGYWSSVIAPQLTDGATVLLVAHGNSLRALSTLIDDLSQEELSGLRLPTGRPVVYSFDRDLRPYQRGGRRLSIPSLRDV
jgi:2,3-bisphosphoglycerate-dependent phosphoglycerate mutase